ncbi:MFS transporter [Streptomyces sp. NPDC002181]|uniref:MFS transporter n=1 Tax=Streptomyces sp. NPDC002181 TaxID=3364635 RepID=UPI0036B27AF3
MTAARTAAGPFASTSFRYLFAGQAISMAGTAIAPVALALGIMEQSGSPSTLSALLIAQTVPTLALLLLGGVWADRLPRRRIVVTCHLVSAAAQAGTGYMLISGKFDLYGAVLLQVAFGMARGFYFPASTGMTQETVEEHQLQSAVAYMSMTRSLSRSLGPLVAGGLLLTVGGGWALVFDAFSYVAAAVLLGRMRTGFTRTVPANSVWRDFVDGFDSVRSRGWIWQTIVLFCAANVLQASLQVLGPSTLGQDHHGVMAWSAIVAAMGAGAVVGDVAATRWRPARPMIAVRVLSLLFVPLPLLIVLDPPVWVLVAAAALGGTASTLADTVWLATLQVNLDKDVISRVSSYDWMGSQVLRPVGLAAAGLFAADSASPMLVALAAVLFLCATASLAPSGVWRITNNRVEAEASVS